jgi:hypothetical protein
MLKITSFLFFTLNVFILAFFNINIYVGFIYASIIFLIINSFLDNRFFYKNFLVYFSYCIGTIIIYFIHISVLPNFYGFSGPLGIGTDDLNFFQEISSIHVNQPNNYIFYKEAHSFALFIDFIYPFPISHPLNVLFINLLGVSFIPYLTYKISWQIFKEEHISNNAFLLVSICPFILANGLIFVRDAWTVTLFLACVYHLLKSNSIKFLLFFALLAYIRLASAMLIFFVALFYLKNILNISHSIWVRLSYFLAIISILLISAYISFTYLSDYLLAKGVNTLFREEFVQEFYGRLFKDSLIYKIYSLPPLLRIPISFLFFFFGPFIRLNFYTEGIFNIRTAMMNCLSPLLFLGYYFFFFRGVFYAFIIKNKELKKIIFIIITLIFIISQISIQFRHKTIVYPFIYIIVAYGFDNYNKLSKQLGYAVASLIALVQIAYLII